MQDLAFHLRRIIRGEQTFNLYFIAQALRLWVVDLQLAPKGFELEQDRLDLSGTGIEEFIGAAHFRAFWLHLCGDGFPLPRLVCRESGCGPQVFKPDPGLSLSFT